jgi:hypothetical protein
MAFSNQHATNDTVEKTIADAGLSSNGEDFNSLWDFNAPMFADFARIAKLSSVHDDDEIDDSSYFS